ncbi:YgaP family membrane protein [Bacillus pinisoli]|uniref:YgaP family membrane protein n=1 Tax=Bacillus pinisoli TaxID=2901866 RepID=UPI001FF2BB69|nr:DUF2892 domain-containing protein [Bacillus pinisoli]
MKPNIGIINALIRLTCGFTMLAWSTARLAKRPYCESYLLVALISAMKIGEGIVRFCPVTYLFQQYQVQQSDKEDDTEQFVGNPT